MESILREISVTYWRGNNDDRKLTNYVAMRQHPGWPVLQEFLLLMRGTIAENMLSKRFTELDCTEKDIRQRTYYNMDEVIRFLLDPVSKARKLAGIAKHNQKMTPSKGQGAKR